MADDIEQLLAELELEKYSNAFSENEIDLSAAVYLTEDDLKELGLPMGPRRKFAAAIERISQNSTEQGATPSNQFAASARTPDAERRQLTVMFCDLVGSTELSRQLDPEELRDLIAHYQDTVVARVTRYEGYVAKYLGDGVLAYFGWPIAFEDQAERAVRSGLDAAAAVAGMESQSGKALSARVGIATGQVVVGDLVGVHAEETHAVTGETPNLAARLQGIARPGEVVIGSNTRRLLGAAFKLQDLGPQELKGFETPIPAWHVVGESKVENRFEAASAGRLAQLVGRDHELRMIIERWDRAATGHGQVVSLTAEAGLGKSRMVRAFRDELEDRDHFRLSYQCSSLHTNTPFYPIANQLARAAGFIEDESAEDRLDKLEDLLRMTKDDIKDDASILATLLALPFAERYGELNLEPPVLRARTIKVLIDQILSLARNKPVLMVLEDAHWLDPTTQELFGELIASISGAAVMILITQRPEYRPPWQGHVQLTTLVLNRLDPAQSEEIVEKVSGGVLSRTVLLSLIDRSGGVPLYLEELTKAVLEADQTGLSADEIGVPDTLQASLVARLDRLEEAKDIAQIGATIGRDFGYDLLLKVAQQTTDQVAAALDALVSSELVFQRGSGAGAHYEFKHALIQDAAYESLLISRRKELHRRIFAAMQASSQAQNEDRVESLAYHAQRGELWDKAVVYYGLAGKRANNRSAYHEAEQFMEAGLGASRYLDNERKIVEQVLDICMNFRPSLGALGKYDRLLEVLSEANQLALSNRDERTATIANINRVHVLNHLGLVEEGLKISEETVQLAREHDEQSMLVAATSVLAMGQFFHGEPQKAVETALEHADDLRASYRHVNLATTATSSVNWLGNLSGMYCYLGDFDNADRWSSESLKIAEESDNPFDEFHAKQWRSNYLIGSAQPEAAVALLEPLCRTVEEYDLGFGRPWAYGWLGDACLSIGNYSKAEETLRYALAAGKRLKLRLSQVWNLARLADLYASTDQAQEALANIDQALAVSEHGGDRWHHPYVLRQRARALAGVAEFDKSHIQYVEAIGLAEQQGALPELAHSRRDLSAFLQIIGDTEGAARERDAAAEIYHRLNVPVWLEALTRR